MPRATGSPRKSFQMATDRQTLRHAAAAAAATFLLYGAFVFVRLKQHDFNPTVFVTAGDEFTDAAAAPPGLLVAPHSPGYDGQFYYRIAIAPWSLAPVAAGVHFDYPVYRYQRVVYPLLVWLVSFGEPAIVPWAMILVNLAALAGIAAASVILSEELGLPFWTPMVVALYPGFLLTLSRDLVEVLEVFLLLRGLIFLKRRAFPAASLFFMLAALTKETSLLFVVAVIAAECLKKPRARVGSLLFLGAPFVAHFAWKVFLFRRWHLPMTFATSEHFMIPFRGMMLGARQAAEKLVFFEIGVLLLFGLVVALAFRRSTVIPSVKVGWLAYAALLLFLGDIFWGEDWGFLRVAAEFAVLGGLIAVASTRWRMAAQTLLAGGWFALAYDLLIFRS